MYGITGIMASFGLLDYFEDQKNRNHRRSTSSHSSPKLNLTLHLRNDEKELKSNLYQSRSDAVKKASASNNFLMKDENKLQKNYDEKQEPKFCWMSEKRKRKCERKEKLKKEKAESDAKFMFESDSKITNDNSSKMCLNVKPRKRLRNCDSQSSDVELLPEIPSCVSPNKKENYYDSEDTIKRKLRKHGNETKVTNVSNDNNIDSARLKIDSKNMVSDLTVKEKGYGRKKNTVRSETDSDSDELPNLNTGDSLNHSLNLLKQYTEDEEEEEEPKAKVIKQNTRHSSNRQMKNLPNYNKNVNDNNDNDDDELEILSHEQETFRFSPTNIDWQSNMCAKLDLVIHKKIDSPQSDVPLAPPAHIRKTSSDGNCFFRCLSFVLTGREKEHAKVRKVVTDYMKEIEPQLEKHLGHNMTVDHYLTETGMAKLSVWSTDVEIFVSSALLNTDIYVYSYYSKKKWKWVKFPAKQLQARSRTATDRRGIYLINTSQLHYDVVTSVKMAHSPEGSSSEDSFQKSEKRVTRKSSDKKF